MGGRRERDPRAASQDQTWASPRKRGPITTGSEYGPRLRGGDSRKIRRMNATNNTVRRTGVIGLGAMGLQMARHMVRNGFEVVGFDIDLDAMRRAVGHGVKSCLSPAQVGEHATVVV